MIQRQKVCFVKQIAAFLNSLVIIIHDLEAERLKET